MILVSSLLLLALLGLSAFFSCTESAMTSASRTWIQNQAEKGDPRASLAGRLLQNSERLLGTILIGNNLANICLTNLANLMIGALLASVAASEQLQDPNSWEEWITSLVVTPVVLVFGEAVPKVLGRNSANALALRTARPIGFLGFLLKPFVILICAVARVLSPRRRDDEPAADGQRVTREDMKAIAEMATEQGLVNKEAGEMLQSVLELDKLPVETAMVPLIEVRSLPESATVGEALALAADTAFLHLPIYRERVDCIVGLVDCRDLLEMKDPAETEEAFLQRPLMPYMDRKILFVPESQPVSLTLEHLRRSSQTMAIVVDEYGGVTGIATVEDLVEIIVGNLRDRREGEIFQVQWISADSFLCSGRMEMGVLEEYLGLSIPHSGFETAAGLVLKLAGRIPAAGERLHYRHVEITVLHVEEHRITRLKFQIPAGGRKAAGKKDPASPAENTNETP